MSRTADVSARGSAGLAGGQEDSGDDERALCSLPARTIVDIVPAIAVESQSFPPVTRPYFSVAAVPIGGGRSAGADDEEKRTTWPRPRIDP